MKTIKLLVQATVQGHMEVDVPTPEEVAAGKEAECRTAQSTLRASHLMMADGEPGTPDAVFAGQLGLNTLAMLYAKQVAAQTEKAIEERMGGAKPLFQMPEGKA